MKWIAAVLGLLVSVLPAFGQTTTHTTDLGGTNLPIPTVQSRLPNSFPLSFDWQYDALAKVLLIHATNNSGKDIVAYNIKVQRKNPDGTLNKSGWRETQTDMLDTLVRIQMAEDPAAERLREHGEAVFAAGTTRDVSMPGTDSPDVEVVADAVFCSDGTFDGQDTRAFKSLLARRQRQLLEMKKANAIMRAALADSSLDHPIAAVIEGLAKAAGESMAHDPEGPNDPESFQDFFFNGDLTSLRNIRPPTHSDTPEREGTHAIC